MSCFSVGVRSGPRLLQRGSESDEQDREGKQKSRMQLRKNSSQRSCSVTPRRGKKVRDLVMQRCIAFGNHNCVGQTHSSENTHRCVAPHVLKKEQFFPPRLLTHLFLYAPDSDDTAIMLGTVPKSACRWFEAMCTMSSHDCACDRHHSWETF